MSKDTTQTELKHQAMFDYYNQLQDEARKTHGSIVYNQLRPGYYYALVADKYFCCPARAAFIIRKMLKEHKK